MDRDAQLPPALAGWLQDQFDVTVVHIRDIGLRDASDKEIFEAARSASAIVMTKDSDFLRLVDEKGTPPQIIWITVGNTSNLNLKRIFDATFARCIELLSKGETIVEIQEA